MPITLLRTIPTNGILLSETAGRGVRCPERAGDPAVGRSKLQGVMGLWTVLGDLAVGYKKCGGHGPLEYGLHSHTFLPRLPSLTNHKW